MGTPERLAKTRHAREATGALNISYLAQDALAYLRRSDFRYRILKALRRGFYFSSMPVFNFDMNHPQANYLLTL